MRLLHFFPKRWWNPRAWTEWKSYVHWRLETFGVYRSEKADPQAMRLLMRQFPSYYRWLGQINRLRRK